MTRSTRPRAFAPDPAAPGRPCDMLGCTHAGEFRAPKSRTELNQYWWFCLEHVRAYNAAWDFYKGMSASQIEAQTRADTGWQRPTWPLGSLGKQAMDETLLHDPLHILSAGRVNRAPPKPAAPTVPSALREPMQTLGRVCRVALDVLKHRYKARAKSHHPDANGGDRASEERLKVINLAYAAVRQHLSSEPRMAAAG